MSAAITRVRVLSKPARVRPCSCGLQGLGDTAPAAQGLSQDVRNRIGQAADKFTAGIQKILQNAQDQLSNDLFAPDHMSQLQNAMQMADDIAATMHEVAANGTITDDTTQQSRQATPDDVNKLFQIAAKQLQITQDLLNNVSDANVGLFMIRVVGGVLNDLSHDLADIGDLLQKPFKIAQTVATVPWGWLIGGGLTLAGAGLGWAWYSKWRDRVRRYA